MGSFHYFLARSYRYWPLLPTHINSSDLFAFLKRQDKATATWINLVCIGPIEDEPMVRMAFRNPSCALRIIVEMWMPELYVTL